MSEISLPFYNYKRTIVIPEWGTIELQPFHILVFLSITPRGYSHCNDTPIFPAIFDTGNSLCLTVHKEQLQAATAWRMQFEPLERNYNIRGVGGAHCTATAFNANAWLHDFTPANVPRSLQVPYNPDAITFKLELSHEGVACIDRISESVNEKNLLERFVSLFKKNNIVGNDNFGDLRQRDGRSTRLSLPHLPLLGLRALCVNYLDLKMTCNPSGGSMKITKREIRVELPR